MKVTERARQRANRNASKPEVRSVEDDWKWLRRDRVRNRFRSLRLEMIGTAEIFCREAGIEITPKVGELVSEVDLMLGSTEVEMLKLLH